jgi:hypothetical protein
MIGRFQKFFGRAPSDERPVGETVAAEPPRELSERRLEELLGSSLRELEDDARNRAGRGEAVGRVVEVRDASGRIVDYRRRTYRSLGEAGADHRRAEIEERDEIDSATACEIAALWPYVSRRALLDALEALTDVTPLENAPQRPQRAVFEATLSLGEGNGAGQAVRDVRRAAVEREVRRFEARGAEKERALRVGAFSDFGERVRLIGELTRWAEEFPELQAAIDSRGREGRA